MKLKTVVAIVKANIKIWYLKATNQYKKILPYKVLLNLTDLCNSRCAYCEIWKIKPVNEISLENIKEVFDSLSDDLLWLSLSGGEVTLVNYYYELVDEAIKRCKNLKILAFTTNALSVNKALSYAEYAKNKGLDVLITISLDGDKETHDKLRGIPGNFEKCEKLYLKLKEKKINVVYGITVSQDNSSFIKEKYSFLRDKIRAATFVHNEGIYNVKNKTDDISIRNSIEIIYKNYFIKNLSEIIEKIHIKLSINFLKKERKENIIPCEVLNTSAHVMPSGDVKPCMFMKSLGNIKNQKFNQIYQSDATHTIRNQIKKDQCPKCWMNCYSPHSIMQNPLKSIINFLF